MCPKIPKTDPYRLNDKASVKQMCIKQINKFGVSKFQTTNKLCCDWVH
jgi:hypothetical protein